MEIALNIGSQLSCGSNQRNCDLKTFSDDDEDVIVVKLNDDGVSYDDIVEDSEIIKGESKVSVFRGFLIHQLLGNQLK